MNKNELQYKKMTETPIPKLIVSLGIPTTISMLITNIYNMADTYFVGKIDTSASAAIGIVFGFMALMQAFGFMFGQGAGSLISRKLGEKDEKRASEYASTAFILVIALGVFLSLISFFFMEKILVFLGSSETIMPYAKKYVAFILLASPFIMSSFVMNNLLRFEGKANLAMIGLVTGGIINIVADPFFIFVCNMGIAGAGLATALSQFISFSILLWMILSGKSQAKFAIKFIKIDFDTVWQIVSTGFPSFVRQGLASISTMLLNNLAVNYSDAAVAAMSIVNRLGFFMFAVGLGMGQGYQPVCAFNYGAKRYDRVKEAFKFTFILCEILLGIMAIVGLSLSPWLVGWFRDDIEVIKIGRPALVYASLALFFQPIVVVSNMTFQTTGQKVKATLSAMFRNGLFFIPALIILEHFFGVKGIEIAQPIADVISFIAVVPMVYTFIKKLGKE